MIEITGKADEMTTVAQMRAYLRGARITTAGTRGEVARRFALARDLAERYRGRSAEEIAAQPGEVLRAQVRDLGHRWSLPKRELATFLWWRFTRPVQPRESGGPYRRLMHVWVTYADGVECLWGDGKGQSHSCARRMAERILQRERERAAREGYSPDAVSVEVDDVSAAYRHGTEARSGQS